MILRKLFRWFKYSGDLDDMYDCPLSLSYLTLERPQKSLFFYDQSKYKTPCRIASAYFGPLEKIQAIDMNNDNAVGMNNDNAVGMNNDNAIDINNDNAIDMNNGNAVGMNNDNFVGMNNDNAVDMNNNISNNRAKLRNIKVPKFYRNYSKVIPVLQENKIWSDLASPPYHGFISEVSRKFQIPNSTVAQWSYNLKKDQNWFPNHAKNPEKSQVFTPSQMDALAERVNILCEDYKLSMTNALFRKIATTYYHSLPEEAHPQKNLEFNCSEHFITKFKKRMNFSRRKAHFKKRPTCSEEEIERFRTEALELFHNPNISPDHIVNCDETFWKIINLTPYTWAKINADNVQIETKDDDKKGFTALATILLSGDTIPMVFIACGTTHTAEKKWFGAGRSINPDPRRATQEVEQIPNPLKGKILGKNRFKDLFEPSSRTDFSKKGWTNEITWENYLRFLRKTIPYKFSPEEKNEQDKIYLFADAYKVHHAEKSQRIADELNIQLISIPKGATDQCQPLDCRIFGALKAQARAVFNQRVVQFITENIEAIEDEDHSIEFPEVTNLEMSAILDLLWSQVSKEQVISAWNKAFHGDDLNSNHIHGEYEDWFEDEVEDEDDEDEDEDNE